MHDEGKAIGPCERARTQWAELGDIAAQMRCLHTLGDLHRRSGDTATAIAEDEQIIALSKQLPHEAMNEECQDHLATAHNRLGSAAFEAKRLAEAKTHFEHCVNLRESLAPSNGPDKPLSDALYWMFLVLKEMGDPNARSYEAKSNACLPPPGEEEEDEDEGEGEGDEGEGPPSGEDDDK
jgi:hypothetical protein